MVTHEHSLVKHFHKRIIQIHSGEIVADTAAMREESAKAPAADTGSLMQLTTMQKARKITILWRSVKKSSARQP